LNGRTLPGEDTSSFLKLSLTSDRGFFLPGDGGPELPGGIGVVVCPSGPAPPATLEPVEAAAQQALTYL